MLCYVMVCYVMLCYGMVWYGMVWYGMLCYAYMGCFFWVWKLFWPDACGTFMNDIPNHCQAIAL